VSAEFFFSAETNVQEIATTWPASHSVFTQGVGINASSTEKLNGAAQAAMQLAAQAAMQRMRLQTVLVLFRNKLTQNKTDVS
jgi:hypothetical protein